MPEPNHAEALAAVIQAALDDDCKYPQLRLPEMQRDRLQRALDNYREKVSPKSA